MKTVLLDYRNLKANTSELAICLGFFDGVHLGHKKLIEEARKATKGTLGVLTFDNSVSSFIKNNKSERVLTSLDDRFKIISKLGVDFYYVMHIDKDFLSLSAEDFIDLLKKMNVKEVFVGSDYCFGKNRSGDYRLLEKHFKTTVVELLNDNNEKISTQEIVSLIESGEIKEANRLLGHNYMVSGSVMQGKGIGRKIGFPTMNIKLATNYVYPRFGVYKTIAYLSNVPHIGICNVGVNPTVNGKEVTIEVHLPHYEKSTYNESISLEFLDFIRPEKKFDSLDELKAQITKDIKEVGYDIF